MDVIVSVSDKYLWALQPFYTLFNKYWGTDQHVIVAGYTPPNFKLPSNFDFYSISIPQYPKEKWVDGFIQFLEIYQHPYFVLMLEDYWLCRKVDRVAVNLMRDYMEQHPNIMRGDLTGDRLYAGGMSQCDYYEYLDIVHAPDSPYEMSTQVAVWNRELFLRLMRSLPQDRHSAWDLELDGTTIVNNSGRTMRVVGTRQWPVMYANGMNNGAGKRVFFDRLTKEDIDWISDYIPKDYQK